MNSTPASTSACEILKLAVPSKPKQRRAPSAERSLARIAATVGLLRELGGKLGVLQLSIDGFGRRRWGTTTTSLVLLATAKLAFLDDHLILFVSRTPDAVTDNAIGLRELPDNPVLATRRPVRLYGRPQPNRLTDFELVHCHALASRVVSHALTSSASSSFCRTAPRSSISSPCGQKIKTAGKAGSYPISLVWCRPLRFFEAIDGAHRGSAQACVGGRVT